MKLSEEQKRRAVQCVAKVVLDIPKKRGMKNPIIKEAASKVGGIVALSLKLGLSRGAVSQWDEVPYERVLAVEALTGVPRSQLRHNLFGTSPGCECTQPQQEAA